MTLDLLPEPPQGAVDERLHPLRVESLGDGGVAGEVGEEHGRLAALLGGRLVSRAGAAGRASSAPSGLPHSMQNFA